MTRFIIPALLLAAFPAFAFDRAAPIDVAADALDVGLETDQAIFSGNVVVTQSDLKLEASKVMLTRNDEVRRPTVEASGSITIVYGNDTVTGDHAVYRPEENVVRMTGNVELTRGSSVLRGETLVYDLATRTFRLETDRTKEAQVQGTFNPADLSDD